MEEEIGLPLPFSKLVGNRATEYEGPYSLTNTRYDGSARWTTVGANVVPGKRFFIDFVIFLTEATMCGSSVLRCRSSEQSDVRTSIVQRHDDLVDQGTELRAELAHELDGSDSVLDPQQRTRSVSSLTLSLSLSLSLSLWL